MQPSRREEIGTDGIAREMQHEVGERSHDQQGEAEFSQNRAFQETNEKRPK